MYNFQKYDHNLGTRMN